MKLRFLDKILLFGGAVLALLSGAFLFVIGVQFFGALDQALPLWSRIAAIILGLLTITLGAYLLLLPRKYKRRGDAFVVQRTDEGELRIAVKAIEALVQKCIDTHEEVNVESMDIHNSREGVTVDLFISLASNISIPLAAASLQKQIKQYLAASSGIDVREVRISVETTQGEDQAEDPAEETPEEAPAEEEAAVRPHKEKKVPLHQRIFGKDDQPVTLPEPPKPEETVTAPEEEAEAEEETVPEEAEEDLSPAESEEASPAPEAEEATVDAPVETTEPEGADSTDE